MAEAVRTGAWAPRLAILALLLTVGGVLAALIGAVGSGQGAWHFRIGFLVLRIAFFAAIAGALLALVGLILARRRRSGKLLAQNLVALVVGLGFLLYLGSLVQTARSVPPIHDIATDLQDVPTFTTLKIRDDNLKNIPDLGDPGLKALDPESRWKAIQRRSYPDIGPLRVSSPVAATLDRAASLAKARGWDIARIDPAAGIIEATDTSRFFRFKDDVVIRVRPDPAGAGSIVDMRSISRVGGSDIGVNAKRIRAFLDDLKQS